MVRCQCCQQPVDAVIPVRTTNQLVCARCYRVIAGMLGVFDVIASTTRQKKPLDA